MANSKFTVRNIRGFWRRTEKSEGCWLWTGAKDRNGYGHIWGGTKQYTTHRFSWELHYSSIPEGLHVCHRCDNPACVNPEHLFLGTAKDNAKDKVDKGRHPTGERHYATKLTWLEVEEIRVLLAAGRSERSVASEFGTSRSNVSHIRAGRSRRTG